MKTQNIQIADHLDQIRCVVSRIAQNDDMIDDIVQECCIHIIEKEKLWKTEPHKIKQWINIVTRNRTIDWLRTHKREQTLKASFFNENVTQKTEKDSEPCESHIHWVLKQFQTLPETQKRILKMRYLEGKKSIQISQELKLVPSVISFHLNKALKTLRKRAKAEGLFSLFLPWNWDFKSHIQEITLKIKTKIILINALIMAMVGGGYLYYLKVIQQKKIKLAQLEQRVTSLKSENYFLNLAIQENSEKRFTLLNQFNAFQKKYSEPENKIKGRLEIQPIQKNLKLEAAKSSLSLLTKYQLILRNNNNHLKSVIPPEIKPAIAKFTTVFNLTDEQKKYLEILLAENSKNKIDISKFHLEHICKYFKKNGLKKTEESTLLENFIVEATRDIQKINEKFNRNLENILTSQQYEKYQQYQKQHYELMQRKAAYREVNDINIVVPDLSDEQKEFLYEYYFRYFNNINLDFHIIGMDAKVESIFLALNKIWDLKKFEQELSKILTTEQFEKYKHFFESSISEK